MPACLPSLPRYGVIGCLHADPHAVPPNAGLSRVEQPGFDGCEEGFTDRIDQTDQADQTNQTDQTDQADQIGQI